MTKAKFLAAAALLTASPWRPSLADARHYRHHHRHHTGGAALPDQLPPQLRPRPAARHLRLLRRPLDQPLLPGRRPPISARTAGGTPASEAPDIERALAGPVRPSLIIDPTHALVAQLDRASDFDSEGREFESLRARHLPYKIGSCMARRRQCYLRGLPPMIRPPPGFCPRAFMAMSRFWAATVFFGSNRIASL